MTFPYLSRTSCFLGLALPFLLASASGCSGPRNAPVDAARARETLRSALESWKQGDKIDSLQHASPAIYVIDPDWQAGFRLKDYQLSGDGEEKDAHLFSTVRLTLIDPSGKEVRREVIYVVSTAPHLTVSRKLF